MDEKTTFFTDGLEHIEERLQDRYYTSVTQFSHDLSTVFSSKLTIQSGEEEGDDRPNSSSGRTPSKSTNLEAIHSQLNEVKPGTPKHLALSQEQRQIKASAKRIVKAIKEPLENAMRKEAELRGIDRDEALRNLDSMALFSPIEAGKVEELEDVVKPKNEADEEADADGDISMREADDSVKAKGTKRKSSKHGIRQQDKSEPLSPPTSTDSTGPQANGHIETDDAVDMFAKGGVPWYLKNFNPMGTTIHDEVYTGRKVLRDMSEELSDMDEDTLTELAVNGDGTSKSSKTKKKAAPKKKPAQRQQPRRSQRT